MADKIVFDSERLEKRQSLKRWLIPVSALLAVVVIAVVIALIVRGGRGKAVTGGEDTSFPYTWTAGKNGVVTLELDRSAAPGYLWTAAETGTQAQMSVAAAQEDGRTRFTLTPSGAGRSVLLFTLHREDSEADCIYELSVLAETADSGNSLRSSLLSIAGRPRQGVVTGGEDTDYPYMIFTDEDGDLVVTVTDRTPVSEETEETDETVKKEEGWICVSEDESIAEVLGIVEGEAVTAAYLRSGPEAGTVLVRMTDSAGGTELLLELEADVGGSLLVRTHRLTVSEPG